jgi:hypothetical protein
MRLLAVMHRYHKYEAALQAEVNAALSAFLACKLCPRQQVLLVQHFYRRLLISVSCHDVLVIVVECKRELRHMRRQSCNEDLLVT